MAGAMIRVKAVMGGTVMPTSHAVLGEELVRNTLVSNCRHLRH
jgi:hypothetical protein